MEPTVQMREHLVVTVQVVHVRDASSGHSRRIEIEAAKKAFF